MKRITRWLAVIGGIVVLMFFLGILAAIFSWFGKEGVPQNTVLEINLEAEIIEHKPSDPFAQLLLSDQKVLRDIVEALYRAADDDKVNGLIAHIGAGFGFAHAQEIRDAVKHFRSKGKFAIAWAETFGEFAPGNGGYYVASAFDEIYLQPSGDIGLTGIRIESLFLRGTLEKLGITPQMDQRYEYKNAMNMMTEREFTAPHEEALTAIMNSLFDQLVGGIAEGRSLEAAAVRTLFDNGPYYGREALEKKLVDGLAYRDEVYEKALSRDDREGRLLYVDTYLERAGRPYDSGETIALIYGVGGVVRGDNEFDAGSGDFNLAAGAVARKFRQASEDKSVKAILFRVDSPGGSYVASDVVWREVKRARAAGKPVIVSMGNVAGSGGYFVAMAADKIVAQPGTITGSIGVLAGKMLTTGFWDKLGISWDDLQSSENAAIWSGLQPYSADEWARFQTALDRIYSDFTEKVAEGRNMPLAEVQIAKGRIWTGSDARELGLIDEVGGLDVALRLAREAAGLGADADVHLKVIPEAVSPWKLIFEEDKENSRPVAAQAIAQLMREIQPAMRLVRQVETGLDQRVLAMPYIDVQ